MWGPVCRQLYDPARVADMPLRHVAGRGTAARLRIPIRGQPGHNAQWEAH